MMVSRGRSEETQLRACYNNNDNNKLSLMYDSSDLFKLNVKTNTFKILFVISHYSGYIKVAG